jgi:SAM-dependent methyltransferase
MNRSRIAISAGCLLAALHAAGAGAQSVVSPFVASKHETVARMLAIAKIAPGERVIDLGSGDGRIVIAAALAEPTVRGYGVDIDKRLVAQSIAAARAAGIAQRVGFEHRNAFDADLRRIDVIFMWLLPELQRLLREKILEEARPGTRVVSASFDMGAWAADETSEGEPPVRLWRVPARVAGNWSWTLELGGKRVRYDAILVQRFQVLDGAVRAGAERRALGGMRLDGAALQFDLSMPQGSHSFARHQYVGRVEGRRIRGEARILVRDPAKPDNDSISYVTLVRPWVARLAPGRSPYHRPTGTPDVDTVPKPVDLSTK